MIDNPLNSLSVKRGEKLPQSKLNDDAVRDILATVKARNDLKSKLKAMTNKALAEKHGVHFRTIDRVTAFENWTHIDRQSVQ